jgi:hypothetical protein
MAGSIRVEIDKRRLKRSSKVMNIVTSFAVGAIINQITEDARAFAPVDEGELKDSIRGRKTNPFGGFVLAEAPHAAATEFGSNPHPIEPKEARFLHFFVDGVEVFTLHVDHPGTPAQPFLRPAFQKSQDDFGVFRAMGKDFLRRLRGR